MRQLSTLPPKLLGGARFGGRDGDDAEVRANRYAHTLEHAVILGDGRGINRQTGIIDGGMNDAERVGLRRPLIVVHGARPIAFALRVQFVDGYDSALLRLFDQIVVLKTPPGRRVAAETFTAMLCIPARPWAHVDDADFEYVARLSAGHGDGPGANVRSPTGARAILRIHRACAAAIDGLLCFDPMVDFFDADVARHHAREVIAGAVGDRLDGNEVPRFDANQRLQVFAEITPVDGLGQLTDVIVPLRRHVAFRRSGNLTHAHGRRAASGRNGRFQKRSMPYVPRWFFRFFTC